MLARAWAWLRWYGHNLFVALDQLVNAIFGGWADETISAHAYRLHRDGKPWGWLMAPINVLFVWQAWDMHHCERAYRAELQRLQAPPEVRP